MAKFKTKSPQKIGRGYLFALTFSLAAAAIYYPMSQSSQLKVNHAALDEQIGAVTHLAAQAKALRTHSTHVAAAPAAVTYAQSFVGQSPMTVNQESATATINRLPAKTFYEGLNALRLSSGAFVSEAQLSMQNGTVTGQVSFNLPSGN